MRSRHILVPCFIVALAVACGSSQGSQFGDNGHSDGGAEGGTSSGSSGTLISSDGSATSSSGGDGTCASKILCGATGTCCETGQECVNDACTTACASSVRCGAGCCNTGEVCLSQACVAPGKACNDSFDCDANEFCEPTIGKCLPQPSGADACLYKPPVAPLALKLEWSWTGSAVAFPDYNQVVNMPAVVDLDNDKFPDVVIVSSKNDGTAYDANSPAYLRALDGRTGVEKWAATVDAYKPGFEVNPRGTPAVADIDGDGTMEIVAPRSKGGVIAFHGDGSLYWSSDTNYQPGSVTIAIADMDNDGKAEVVEGGLVFDGTTGKLAFPQTYTVAKDQYLWGANDYTYGPVSLVADIDGIEGSHDQMVVTGNRAFKKSGFMVWDQSATLSDGYPAIADLDKDGTPELVVIAQGNLRVQNAITGVLIDTIQLPGTGRGGPPTISDFDNDGALEIASANGTKYNVFKYAGKKLSSLWSQDTQDGSSNVTGSSVFDFEGDGSSEVIYNDECYSRVYRGKDGSELYKIANSSATIHEMPVLVDVDGDNHTELLVVANDVNHLSTSAPVKCLNYDAAKGEVPRHGVFSYGDANNKWVRTRKVWNQHAYHVTNVLADGKIPAIETRSFVATENNDYRVSEQGKGVYNAPDLQVDLTVSLVPCPASIDLQARVSNGGSLGVPAGVSVAFYAGADATGQLLGNGVTTKALLPGESEVVTFSYVPTATPATSFFVSVDGTAVTGVINECLTDNNTGKTGGVRCPTVR